MKTRALRNHGGILAFTAGLLAAVALQLHAQQTNGILLEVVNDTGIPDSQILFQFTGKTTEKPASITNAAVLPTNAFTSTDQVYGSGTNVPLTTLASDNPAGSTYTVVSPTSGNANTVYPMYVSYVQSGQIYFQFGGTPYNNYNNANNTPSANPTTGYLGYSPNRFEYVEMSFMPTNSTDSTTPSAADMTYVNKFGMPVQLDWYDSTNTNSRALINSSSVLLPTKDLVAAFQALKLSAAVYGFNGNNSTQTSTGTNQVVFPTSLYPRWTGADLPTGQSYTNFARVINPYSLYATAAAGTYPYPSLSYYLNSLTNTPFQLNGAAPQGTYWYAGYNVTMSTYSDTSSAGWKIKMEYGGSVPANLNSSLFGIGKSQYTDTLEWKIPYAGATFTIFEAPSAPSNFYKNGVLNPSPNAVESWMLGDVQTAITAGYWGGTSTNSENWYITKPFVPPAPGPFALARATNDGNYNLFASILYANTDGYGYTYAERFTPSVLIAPCKGQTLRITLLPDSRLAAPQVTTSNITTSSITLNWPAVSGASQYMISTVRPLNVAPVTIPSATSYTVPSLTAGQPYTFIVQAQATNAANSNLVSSSYRPVSTSTLGTPTTATNNGTIAVRLSISPLSDPFQRVDSVYFNGTTYPGCNGNGTSGATSVDFMANPGTNQLPIAVYDTNSSPVFFDWLTFVINTNSATTASVTNVAIHGNSYPVPTAFQSGSSGNFVISTNLATPSFQIPFTYSPAFAFTPSQGALTGGTNNYTTWISQYYTTSPEDFPESDHDKDGASNLQEYFQARDPMVPDADGAQTAAYTANTNAGTLAANFGSLSYSFRKSTTPNELVSSALWSSDMTNWQSDGMSFTTNAPGGAGYNCPTYQVSPVTSSNVYLQFEATLP
ncbi:MAG: fibronectin type III domain-containing protein [Verrucomicrobiae bacterium]